MIETKSSLDIHAEVDSMRQRNALRQTFHICKKCDRTLSIAEFIERHCESCNAYTRPIATKEPAA